MHHSAVGPSAYSAAETEASDSGTAAEDTSSDSAGKSAGDSPYPDWYDPERDAPENEPALPRDQGEKSRRQNTEEEETVSVETETSAEAESSDSAGEDASGDA